MMDFASDRDAARSLHGAPFAAPWRYGGTIIDRLKAWADSHPGDPYLTMADSDGLVGTLTYGEFAELSRRFAGWLRSEVGARAGDTIAVLPRNDICSVVAIFGLLRAGCRVLLLNPADPLARLEPQATAMAVKAVLRSPAVDDGVFPTAVVVPDACTLPPCPGEAAEAVLDPAADALYFGTSGSTASAKLVAQSHYNVVSNATALGRHHQLRPGDRILGCLPIHHVNGLHFTVFGVLFARAHVNLTRSFSPLTYAGLLEGFRPRIASVVPSMLEAMLETRRYPRVPDDSCYFVSAAAPLAAATARRVQREIRMRVLQGYGLSETTNFATQLPPGTTGDTYRRLVTEPDIPSAGVPLACNEVAILRPDGSRAEMGESGEICMRGHNVMARYAGNDEATRDAFRNGWFHSQDIGFMAADPAFDSAVLFITGRLKNIAKIGGETVSLDEMERLLRGLPQVRDAACVCLPDRFTGDKIIAAAVLAPGAKCDLRGTLRAAFPAAAMPRHIVLLDVIPRTATGKILRPQLAAALGAVEAERPGQVRQAMPDGE
jgi:acyl-CoA synthetase (AMP-forming)/AMP-acid ligase II